MSEQVSVLQKMSIAIVSNTLNQYVYIFLVFDYTNVFV